MKYNSVKLTMIIKAPYVWVYKLQDVHMYKLHGLKIILTKLHCEA